MNLEYPIIFGKFDAKGGGNGRTTGSKEQRKLLSMNWQNQDSHHIKQS